MELGNNIRRIGYQILSNSTVPIALIDGKNGDYDGKIENSSAKYGRNAASNFNKYLSDYSSKVDNANFEKDIKSITENPNTPTTPSENEALAPISFVYNYLPEGKPVDTLALMGVAYEEMDKKTEMDAEELSKKLNAEFKEGSVSTKAIDLNKDGKIDLAEYSTTILMSDKLSNDGKIKGQITKQGLNSIQNKFKPGFFNTLISKIKCKKLYNKYSLGKAQQEFLANKNNLIA